MTYFNMNLKRLLFILFLFSLQFWKEAEAILELRATPVEMSTSVIIPCHHTHFQFIEKLLIHYTLQTVLPDEIVISLSGSNMVLPQDIDRVKDQPWPFTLIIQENIEELSSGKNRNISCSQASGDIIICQDADDLPHPQRVELIKHLFQHFKLEHLMHFYRYNPRNVDVTREINMIDIEQTELLTVYSDDFNKLTNSGLGTYGEVGIHCGNIAISRSVFDEIQWPEEFTRREDTDYNLTVYALFQYKALLKFPLLFYRQYLSTDRAAVKRLDL